jgi:transposase
MTKHKPYPSDVSDEKRSFAVGYMTLMNKEAPQRKHELREVSNALRWIARTGVAWRELRSVGGRLALDATRGARASGPAQRCDSRWAHAVIDLRKRGAGRV